MGIWIPTTWIPNFLKLGFQMVQYSKGWSVNYVLCTRPTIQIPDQYIRKQGGVHLSGIQRVGLSSIQMAFEYQTPNIFLTIQIPNQLGIQIPLHTGRNSFLIFRFTKCAPGKNACPQTRHTFLDDIMRHASRKNASPQTRRAFLDDVMSQSELTTKWWRQVFKAQGQ